MARKRTIDPEIWTEPVVANLSMGAHLLWFCCISLADDYGRLEWSALQILARGLPGKKDVWADDVRGWMREIENAGLVVVYNRSDGKKIAQHAGWFKHQTVGKPSRSKYPAPPDDKEIPNELFYTRSGNNPQPPRMRAYRRRQWSYADRLRIFARFDNQCVYCGSPDDLELDHIVPLYHGGADDEENLQPACSRCNRSKGKRLVVIQSQRSDK